MGPFTQHGFQNLNTPAVAFSDELNPRQDSTFCSATGALAGASSLRLIEVVLVVYALFESEVFWPYRLFFRGELTFVGPFPWRMWFRVAIPFSVGLAILAYILWQQRVRGSSCRTRVSPTIQVALELALVVWVAFAGSVFGSFSQEIAVPSVVIVRPMRSWVNDSLALIDKGGVLVFLAYVLRCNGSGFSVIGLQWTSRAAAMTLPLLITTHIVNSVLMPFIFWGTEIVTGRGLVFPDVDGMLFGNSVRMLLLAEGFLNGFYEELLVRAFLMTWMARLTGRIAPVIFASVALQTSYHFYQGTSLALSHVPTFLVYAVYYGWTKNALPVALAHSCEDLFALVRHSSRL